MASPAWPILAVRPTRCTYLQIGTTFSWMRSSGLTGGSQTGCEKHATVLGALSLPSLPNSCIDGLAGHQLPSFHTSSPDVIISAIPLVVATAVHNSFLQDSGRIGKTGLTRWSLLEGRTALCRTLPGSRGHEQPRRCTAGCLWCSARSLRKSESSLSAMDERLVEAPPQEIGGSYEASGMLHSRLFYKCWPLIKMLAASELRMMRAE